MQINKKVIVKCPGSCGELFQGYLGQKEFLSTIAINCFSEVSIEPFNNRKISSPLKTKSRQAFLETTNYLKIPDKFQDVTIQIRSHIPVGKGMSSSTADIVAVIYATATYYGYILTEKEVAKICCQIEKTDSILFSKMTVMSPSDAEVLHQNSWVPDVDVLLFEPKQRIDTQSYHLRRNEHLVKSQEPSYQEIYQLYKEAVAQQSIDLLGIVATKSAILNQKILAKPFFKEFLKMSENPTILGVIVAHSGTIVGLLCKKNSLSIKDVYKDLRNTALLQYYPSIKLMSVISGGIYIEQENL